MAGCLKPMYAYIDPFEKTANGKNKIHFMKAVSGCKPESLFGYEVITLPCGQCIQCRLARSRRWAVRLMHELKSHEKSAYITLTYNDENLPSDHSVHVRDFQLFMKVLRRHHPECQIRFFHCGEYGEQSFRPHYHAIIFGYDFPDRVFKRFNFRLKDVNGDPIQYYTSAELEKLWGRGNVLIGDVTFESCAYVARYIMKKVTGKAVSEEGYKVPVVRLDESGEYVRCYSDTDTDWLGNPVPLERVVEPPYVTMSRKPGIGYEFYMKYFRDMYPRIFALILVVRSPDHPLIMIDYMSEIFPQPLMR